MRMGDSLVRLISLPFVALVTISAAPSPDSGRSVEAPLPLEYRPCTGSVPVFNPEGCPVAAIAIDQPIGPLRGRPATAEGDCPDRIRKVREELDQPRLERKPASSENPVLIAAVDKRIDGCAVMQMRNDINDLRPIPAPADGPPRLQPAR
ncbi:hypothetical protein A6F68_01985 [Tsuneonella dongtanensis]|uniref:Uncharacterized protein n=1 Tax=Tsuneonella dongtanensis TaxID=692370 RepID=A0A1B2AEB9_9SPHN|nr:hypothetical protein A6F68_01985 [Tsuneonella dongtanensis]